MGSTIKPPKAKLPRKRKKAAIKAQGRKWYYDTIQLFYRTYGTKFGEKKCKFWVNSSIRNMVFWIGKTPMIIKEPTRYW